MNYRLSEILALIVSLLLVFCVALSGSQFEPGDWYSTLAKPNWTPPSWIFPIAWTYLYLTMAISVWLVWRHRLVTSIKVPLTLYVAQLALNALWSWLFFGLHSVTFGLIDIAALLILVMNTMIAFWRISVVAGVLFLPYLVWLLYATALNFRIWQLN